MINTKTETRGGVKEAWTFQSLVSVVPWVAVCPLRSSLKPSSVFVIKSSFPSYAYSTVFLFFFTTKRALLNFPVPEEQEQKDSRCPDLTGQRSWLYSVLTLSPLSNGPRKGEEEVNGRAP